MEISWVRYVSAGRNVINNESWISNSRKFLYRDGYEALRMIKINNEEYEIKCRIYSSMLGKPLFAIDTKKVSGDHVIQETEIIQQLLSGKCFSI